MFLEPKSKQLIARLRKLSYGFNEEILSGISDAKLEATAVTLGAMKKNLLSYLQEGSSI